jgi:small subunit ribosomal protein S1
MENQVQTESQNQAESSNVKKPALGDLIRGQIHTISGQVAFLQYGPFKPYINLSEFRNEDGTYSLNLGDEIEAIVVSVKSGIELSHSKIAENVAYDELKDAFNAKKLVEGEVISTNAGGYEVKINGVRAFCPASQFAERYESNPKRQIGKKYTFSITEFSKKGSKRNVVLSRKSVLEAEKQEKTAVFVQKFKKDDVIKGTVTRVVDFGAFVRLDENTEGLLRASEVSYEKVSHKDKVKVGDVVEVKILSLDADKQQVALSMKALLPDPWNTYVQTLEVFQDIKGTVTRLVDFGAFVRLSEGVEGLLHVSSMSKERVESPAAMFKVGDELDLVVEEIVKDANPEKRRLRLMTKAVAESKKPAEFKIKSEVGNVVKAVVTEVKKNGLVVSYSEVEGFVPSSETNTEKGSKLEEKFKAGDEVQVRVMEVENKRVRFSIKAVENGSTVLSNEYQIYKKNEKENAASNKLATFGELLKTFLNK